MAGKWVYVPAVCGMCQKVELAKNNKFPTCGDCYKAWQQGSPSRECVFCQKMNAPLDGLPACDACHEAWRIGKGTATSAQVLPMTIGDAHPAADGQAPGQPAAEEHSNGQHS